ncbi:MAG: protein phosphatase 2C domain-containing protein [Ilumatobacteraceae bacterium]
MTDPAGPAALDLPSLVCPTCGASITPTDAFCESCGATLQVGAAAAVGTSAADATETGDDTPGAPPKTTTTRSPANTGATSKVCASCGGEVLDDGFCGTCGQRALSERDHWEEQPVEWIGGVCDKGILHARNEDAMALAGIADGSLGVLVVCDGVTTAPDSDRAALAAARAACAALLATAGPPPSASAAALIDHASDALIAATAQANVAAVGVARALGNPSEPPSCTFVAGIVAGDMLTVAWCGDSRAYWLPDDGDGLQLSTDHSLGTEMIRSGKSQEEAEADPVSHTITRWLGADSNAATSEVASLRLDAPGWVLLCSDGLWNSVSTPEAIRGLIRTEVAKGLTGPARIAGMLVAWANEQGGHDNITAALARFDPSLR